MANKTAKHFPVMENMTVKEVREYLQTKKSIILPIGVIEQHGYHLPLYTDALIATHLGRMIGKQTGILVAPTFHQSFSGGGLPGTINISPAVMSLAISDTLISLVSQGFRNFYLFLCHGGSENARALKDAIQVLLRTNPAFSDVMIVLSGVWDFGAEAGGLKKAFGEGDWHAGWFETSFVMALEPDLVQMDQLETDIRIIISMRKKSWMINWLSRGCRSVLISKSASWDTRIGLLWKLVKRPLRLSCRRRRRNSPN
jgi:creatinine amidohydrolase